MNELEENTSGRNWGSQIGCRLVPQPETSRTNPCQENKTIFCFHLSGNTSVSHFLSICVIGNNDKLRWVCGSVLGICGRIASCSGLAFRDAIHIMSSVVDTDYTGPVRVLLYNHGSLPYALSTHQSISQLIYKRIFTPKLAELRELPPPSSDNGRGDRGLGSSGLF